MCTYVCFVTNVVKKIRSIDSYNVVMERSGTLLMLDGTSASLPTDTEPSWSVLTLLVLDGLSVCRKKARHL